MEFCGGLKRFNNLLFERYRRLCRISALQKRISLLPLHPCLDLLNGLYTFWYTRWSPFLYLDVESRPDIKCHRLDRLIIRHHGKSTRQHGMLHGKLSGKFLDTSSPSIPVTAAKQKQGSTSLPMTWQERIADDSTQQREVLEREFLDWGGFEEKNQTTTSGSNGFAIKYKSSVSSQYLLPTKSCYAIIL